MIHYESQLLGFPFILWIILTSPSIIFFISDNKLSGFDFPLKFATKRLIHLQHSLVSRIDGSKLVRRSFIKRLKNGSSSLELLLGQFFIIKIKTSIITFKHI